MTTNYTKIRKRRVEWNIDTVERNVNTVEQKVNTLLPLTITRSNKVPHRILIFYRNFRFPTLILNPLSSHFTSNLILPPPNIAFAQHLDANPTAIGVKNHPSIPQNT